MSTFPVNKQQDFLGGLLSFLQSPEAKGLSAGLLQGSAPSMTQPTSFGGALGFGLQNAQKFGEADQKRKLAEKIFGLDVSKFGLEQQKHLRELQQQQELMDLINSTLGTSAPPQSAASSPVPSVQEGSLPPIEEETIVVTHPQLNNGQPTKVASKLNGRNLSEKEAIDIALARKEEEKIIGKSSEPSGGLLSQGSPTKKEGGLLTEGRPEAQRKAILARGLILAGDKAGAIKTLFGKDAEHALTGLPREYQSLNELEKIDPEAARMAKEELDLRRANQKIMGQSREQLTKLRKWNSLTADQKENVLAEGRSLGVSDQELLDRYSNGETNYDIARELGMNEDEAKHLDKTFAPTSATRTAVQSTEGALAEEKWIAPKITDAMKPYARKIFGTSPAFVKDAFSTDPKVQKQVAKALAARALQPEIAGFRSRAAGGSNAHGALQELTDKSLNELHVWEAQVSPEVYEMAQNILSEWIHGMGDARVQTMKGVKKSEAQTQSQEMVTIRNPKTGETKRVTREEAENLTRKK